MCRQKSKKFVECLGGEKGVKGGNLTTAKFSIFGGQATTRLFLFCYSPLCQSQKTRITNRNRTKLKEVNKEEQKQSKHHIITSKLLLRIVSLRHYSISIKHIKTHGPHCSTKRHSHFLHRLIPCCWLFLPT